MKIAVLVLSAFIGSSIFNNLYYSNIVIEGNEVIVIVQMALSLAHDLPGDNTYSAEEITQPPAPVEDLPMTGILLQLSDSLCETKPSFAPPSTRNSHISIFR